jgi:hypothetical protein
MIMNGSTDVVCELNEINDSRSPSSLTICDITLNAGLRCDDQYRKVDEYKQLSTSRRYTTVVSSPISEREKNKSSALATSFKMSKDSSSSKKLWSRGSESTGKLTDEPIDQQETKNRSQDENTVRPVDHSGLTTARYPRKGTGYTPKPAGSSSRSHGLSSKISNVLRKSQTNDGSVRLKDEVSEPRGSGTGGQAVSPGASVSHVVTGGITATVTVQPRDDQADDADRRDTHDTKPRTWDRSSSESDIGPEVAQKEFW